MSSGQSTNSDFTPMSMNNTQGKLNAELDSALISEFKAGDKAAFDALFEKYQAKIIRLVGHYIRDASESNDITQEVFIRAYQSIDQFRGESSFYTWLYRIAINTAKNHLALKSRSSCFNVTDEQLENWNARRETNREASTPEGVLISYETEEQFFNILCHLPLDLRTAITLREQEGKTYEEIAEIMGCPIGTVRSRIFRARVAIDKGMHLPEQELGPNKHMDSENPSKPSNNF